MKKVLFLLYLLCLFSTEGRGQQRNVWFNRLPDTHPLSQVRLHSAIQDRKGYIWLATSNGVTRYDGLVTKTFKPIPFDTSSLSNRVVVCLLEDRQGNIWVGTRNGLNCLNPKTGKVQRFLHNALDDQSLSHDFIQTLAQDLKGHLWVGTHKGLNRFDFASRKFTRYYHEPGDPQSINDDEIKALQVGRMGSIWVGTPKGLSEITLERGHVRHYWEASSGSSPNADQDIREVKEDPEEPGVLWVLTARGLGRYVSATGEWQVHLSDLLKTSNRLKSFLFFDPTNPDIIWINGRGRGIVRFEKKSGQYTLYQHNPQDPRSLLSNEIPFLFIDRSGIGMLHAVGVNQLGTYVFDIAGNAFENIPIRLGASQIGENYGNAILEDSSGNVWVGTNFGLNRKQPEDGRLGSFSPVPAMKNSSAVKVIMEDREGDLWIGSMGGAIHRFDRRTGRFRLMREGMFARVVDFFRATVLVPSPVILEDQKGTIWIGTPEGIRRFDQKSETFLPFETRDLKGKKISVDPSALFEDREGRLWVGTRGDGLAWFRPEEGVLHFYRHDPEKSQSLSENSVQCIYQDRVGRLWVGTIGGGLNRLEANGSTFTHYTEQEGLADNAIHSILEDETGRLWLSTANGLSRLDPETGKIRNFAVGDGLKSNMMDVGGSFKNRKGEMFFGSVRGYTRFTPSLVQENQVPPPVELIGIRLFNVPLAFGEDSLLQRPLEETKEITFSYNQNTLTFEFVALHFQNPESNRYAYQLVPFDQGWVDGENRRQATYTNLSPGEYVFKVKAANPDGVWNEQGASITIQIQPPWWKTWWAYAVYLFVLLAVMVAIFRLQRQRLLRRERERVRERELDQAKEMEQAYHELKRTQAQLIQSEKMASLGELTAGIAHEIQNPLNFVNNFSEVSRELVEELREEAQAGRNEEVLAITADLEQNLQKIHHHGSRADAIVKNMLQHSRSTAGEKKLTNLNALADEYLRLAYHGLRAKDKSFTCTLDTSYDLKLEKVEVVPQDLGRVLLNIFNNAFYAVQEKQKLVPAGASGEEEGYTPRVTVSTHQREGQVEIKVRDNGTGMPESVKQKIFQPFFTTKPTGEGTGLGLSLSYDIITKGHGGELKVESEKNKYTEFKVELPLPKGVRLRPEGKHVI